MIGRSSHPRCSIKKVFFKILENSQESTYSRIIFFNNVESLSLLCTYSHWYFPVNIAKFWRASFLTEHLLDTASGLRRNLRIYLYLQQFAYWLSSLPYFSQDALKIFWLKGEMDSIFSNSFLNVSYISHYTMVFLVNFAKCFIENT